MTNWPGLMDRDRAADLLDDAAVLVPHRSRFGDRTDAAVGPQVGPAHAGRRELDDGIRRLNDLRVGALLEPHVARPVENRSSHGLPPLCRPLRRSGTFDPESILATGVPGGILWPGRTYSVPEASRRPAQPRTYGPLLHRAPALSANDRTSPLLGALAGRVVCQFGRARGSNVTLAASAWSPPGPPPRPAAPVTAKSSRDPACRLDCKNWIGW